jgi:hypothetical protein
MKRRIADIAPPQQQEAESIVCAGQLGLDGERASIAPDCLVELSELRVGDGHVLEDLVIVGLLAEGEPV